MAMATYPAELLMAEAVAPVVVQAPATATASEATTSAPVSVRAPAERVSTLTVSPVAVKVNVAPAAVTGPSVLAAPTVSDSAFVDVTDVLPHDTALHSTTTTTQTTQTHSRTRPTPATRAQAHGRVGTDNETNGGAGQRCIWMRWDAATAESVAQRTSESVSRLTEYVPGRSDRGYGGGRACASHRQ
jgi:hypothetical protein